ncbi:MAG TPA: methyltransferase domain-containing protein [Pseudolabrys sp.]|jgi:SAM-dependent methyltransferase
MPRGSERIVDLYERNAHAWDEQRGRPRPLMEQGWLDRFTALIRASDAILDIGCGSGKPIAAHLIAQGYAVTGIDSSTTMIDMCSDRFPAHRWQIADMRTLLLETRSAGIIAWDSFFHLSPDDQRLMFPIFRAHAEPGAPLLFTSGPRHGDAIGSFEGEPLYHGSLDPGEYRTLLRDNGFAVVDHVAEDTTCGGHTVWLAQRDNAA